MRDIIDQRIALRIDVLRPQYQYGTVATLDSPNYKATVNLPNEPAPVPVRMGATQPSAIGQTVRVEGVEGDRFISDVLGPVYVMGQGKTGDLKASLQTADHDGWVIADGRSAATATYPTIFALIGYTYGGSGANFNFPDWRGRTIVGAGTGASLTNRVLGTSGGAETHTLVNGEMPIHGHGGASANEAGDHSHNNTGYVSHDHAHNASHYHTGNVSNSYYTSSTGHYHSNQPGYASEGANPANGVGASFAVNIDTASFDTGGITQNHYHATGGRSASHNHGISNDGGGGAHNNMQPWRAANIFIKT